MTETAEKKSADACTEALRTYGAELLGYLEAIHPPDDAQEVFARACERIWKGMDGFRGESSLRTWLYVVVSNESKRYLSRPEARRRSETMGSFAAPGTRTATPAYRRTGPKEALRAFRDGLPPEERMLLVLRVDRELAWKDVTRALGNGEEPSATEIARRRKQFERIKEKLEWTSTSC